MKNPIIANNKPSPVNLKKGEEYYFLLVESQLISLFATVHMQTHPSNPKLLPRKKMEKLIFVSANIVQILRFVMALINSLVMRKLAKKVLDLVILKVTAMLTRLPSPVPQ
ncbi:MAG: hypothetical protein ACI88H_000343 [Cocleimonas sp.]|jgi:hypothetical protein